MDIFTKQPEVEKRNTYAIEESFLRDFFRHFTMELIPPMVEMQLRGVRIDPEARDRLREWFVAERGCAIERLEAFSGSRIMAKKTLSNVAVMDLLYNKMKLPVQKHPKTKQPTADKKALEKLSLKVNDEQRPIFIDIMTVRDLGVEISTFLDAKLDHDQRLRWSTNIAGTINGRISTSASPFWTGTNVQNWNEEVRNIVLAEDGYCFLYADGEQAEARAVAYLAEDPELQRVFSSDISVHAQMANRIFGIPLADTEEKLEALKKREEYKLSKMGVHAANYNMSAKTAAVIMRKTEWEANKVLEGYHASFPGVRSVFHRRVKDQVEKYRSLSTPFWRRRQFFDRMGPELIRGAIAYIPQSTIADWLDTGLLRAYYFSKGMFNNFPDSIMCDFYRLPEVRYASSFEELKFKKDEFFLNINIHDGLLAQVKISELRRGINLMKEALTFTIPFPNGGNLTIPIDIKIGGRWGSLFKASEKNIAAIERGEKDIYAIAA